MIPPRELRQAVEEFARELETLFADVLRDTAPRFAVVAAPEPMGDGSQRFVVRPEVAGNGPLGPTEVDLQIDGESALALSIEYRCMWDHAGRYLAIDRASWAVRTRDTAEPLFRYEYVSAQGGDLPAAHLHVHAHRDELVYTLFRAGRGRPKRRGRNVLAGRRLPHLSDVHFPLGGERMRPCLEDLLQLLIVEFGIDAASDAIERLAEGRARWRRHQSGAIVRDAPDEAVRVLAQLGYSITPPQAGAPASREAKLRRY